MNTHPPAIGSTTARAEQLFLEAQLQIHRRTDRLFAFLMGFQWVAGIIFALWISPVTWAGTTSQTHVHVWAAVVLGGVISAFPALLALTRPGLPSTRYTIATAQMLMGALLIHLTGGRLETHFHVFGSLAFLAFYRNWQVLIPATIVVALDHLLRGMFWPQSVYGVVVASQWRWLEHAAWVVFEDVFLIVSCITGIAEMRQTAERTAALEQEVRTRQHAESEAHSLASLASAVGLALTRDVKLPAMLQHCADALVRDLDGGLARIWTLDDTGADLELRASAGIETALTGPLRRVPVGGAGSVAAIAATRQGIVTDAAAADPQLADATWVSREGMTSFAGYPLLVDSKLVGVMTMFCRRELSASAREAMAAVADGVAVGIERKRAEAELAALVEELRIAQRQAEAATRAKSDFLASMSHELRTPLNAIILYSELLEEEAQDRGQQGSITDLQRIQSAGKHLLQLINGILDLSKIEAGKMGLSIETFEIASMLDGLLDTVTPLAQKNRNTVTVHAAGAGTMTTDLMKTRQILLNLLSNASKFTKDGTIAVEVRRVLMHERPAIEFVVTDSGVGMKPEQAGKIFEAFTQADVTTTRKYGGTGLGLALVSRFCQLMGGDVAVETSPDAGSRFTVRLPAEITEVTPDGELVGVA